MSEMTEEQVRARLSELHDDYKDDPESAAIGLIDGLLGNSHVNERDLFDAEELIRQWEDPDIKLDMELVKKYAPVQYKHLTADK